MRRIFSTLTIATVLLTFGGCGETAPSGDGATRPPANQPKPNPTDGVDAQPDNSANPTGGGNENSSGSGE